MRDLIALAPAAPPGRLGLALSGLPVYLFLTQGGATLGKGKFIIAALKVRHIGNIVNVRNLVMSTFRLPDVVQA